MDPEPPPDGPLYDYPVIPPPCVSLLKRPYGLPKSVRLSDYLADPVCYFSAYNYKVNASVGSSITSTEKVMAVLDTGAGPNLVRADLLPDHTLSTLYRKKRIVNLASASNHRLKTLGIAMLTVNIEGYICREPFVVVQALAADVILGATYIDRHGYDINIRQQTFRLIDGTTVPIRCRAASIPKPVRSDEPTQVAPRGRPKEELVRVAQSIVLPPETNVKVISETNSTVLLEPAGQLYTKRQISLSNGIAYIRKNVPYPVRVANFSTKERRLPKNQVLGFVTRAPHSILTIDMPDAQAPGHPAPATNTVVATAEPPPGEGGEGLASSLKPPLEPPLGVSIRRVLDEPDTECPEPLTTVLSIDLDHLSDKKQKRVRQMLAKYSSMWSGELGVFKDATHRIQSHEDAKPFRVNPYRTGPQGRASIRKAVTEMKEGGVIRDATSDWASPVVLTPKPDGSMRFCVDYRRLNSLTVKNSYPLPRMEDCLDSLGEAQYFTALDCNSGY